MTRLPARAPRKALLNLAIIGVVFALILGGLVAWAYFESENLADLQDETEGFGIDLPIPEGILPPPARMLQGLETATGRERWQAGFPEATSFVGASGDVVIVDDPRAGLVAIELATGEERWRRGPALSADCAVIDGNVVIGVTRRGRVVARDTSSGLQVWSAALEDFVCDDLIAASGTAIVGGIPDRRASPTFLMAFESATGAQRWQLQGREIPGIPLKGSSSGLFFTADSEGSIHALDAMTGAVRWTWTPDRPVKDSLVLTATSIRAVIAGPTIGFSTADPDARKPKDIRTITVFVGATDGIERWRTKSGAASSFAYDPQTDTLIEIGEPPTPVGRDPSTGTLRWTGARDGEFSAATPGLALVGAANNVVALDATTGTPIWTFEDLAQNSLVPLGGAGGVVFVGRE